MGSYFFKRLLLMIPTLLGISIVSFVIIHLTPGDPALLKLGDDPRTGNPAQIINETRALYGLDQPLYVQYLRWLKRMVTLDFGESLRDHRPIIDKLKERIPVSVKLSGISLLFAYLISIPLGVYSATHQYSIGDRITTIHCGLPEAGAARPLPVEPVYFADTNGEQVGFGSVKRSRSKPTGR